MSNKCLGEAAAVHAAALGNYYQAERTDFDACRAAAEVANTALRLAGGQTDSLSAELSDSAPRSPDPALIGERIERNLAGWRSVQAGVLSGVQMPEARPISELVAWCAAARSALEAVHRAMAEIEAVTGQAWTVNEVRQLAANVSAARMARTAIDEVANTTDLDPLVVVG